MKVHNDQACSTVSAPLEHAASTERTGRTSRYEIANAPPSGQDQVELSSLVHRISATSDVIAAGRAARVQDLARDYRSGRYAANPEEISRRLVSEWLPATPASETKE